MSGLPELSRDLAKEYRITVPDANELIQFINRDIINRLARGEVLHIDQFGSFHAEDKKIWFNPSKFMQSYIDERLYEPKVPKEKPRGDRWKDLHQAYLQKIHDTDRKESS